MEPLPKSKDYLLLGICRCLIWCGSWNEALRRLTTRRVRFPRYWRVATARSTETWEAQGICCHACCAAGG